METVIDYLKRKLRESGAASWPAIAEATGCSPHLLRKVAYNDRDNPGVQTIQPLLDYFQALDLEQAEAPKAARA
jgi:hypothetical protein